jgi:hypothetical protein
MSFLACSTTPLSDLALDGLDVGSYHAWSDVEELDELREGEFVIEEA